MTIDQMHVQVRQEVNQIGTTRRRDFLPGQLDLHIQVAIYTFIDSCLRKRENGTYEILKEEDIQTLVVLDEPLLLLPNPVRGLLPHNFWKFCSDSSLVICGTSIATSYVKEFFIYKKVTTQKPVTPYFEITDNTDVLLPAAQETKDPITETTVQDVLISTLRRSGVKVWETLPGMANGEFALEQNKDLQVDGTALFDRSIPITIVNYDQTGSKPVANSLTPAELAHDRQFTPFYRSSLKAPVTVLTDNKLRVYTPYSGIVTGLFLNYVRKPATVSLNLGNDCDLPESTHLRICKLAAEQILLDTKDPAATAKVQFNQLRSQPAN